MGNDLTIDHPRYNFNGCYKDVISQLVISNGTNYVVFHILF